MPSIPQISDAIDILNTHLSGCYPSTTKPLLLTYNPSARIPQREGYNEALKARASELSQLLSLRGAVDKRIAYIHAQMNDIRTACAGASALPVEILEYIFTIIAPPGVPHRSRFVMRIAQVSKRWRTVALWHKAFWTEFDFGSPTAGEPELLGTFIKRARPSNLLTLVAHNPASLDVALRYSVVSSLKKLHVAFDASHLSNAIQHLSTNPLLTGLISLGLHIQDDDRLLTDGPFMAPSIISLTTPSLRHITFTKCRTWDVSIEQYCRIESLAFSQCDFWPPFIALFGYLRDLRLVRVETPRSGGDAGFELRCLGSLVIQSCSEAFIECFFRMITFPALRSCRLISPSTSHFPSELNYTEDIARVSGNSHGCRLVPLMLLMLLNSSVGS
ncbi:uncharacterized protein EI90DRAFT_3043883 [Cantharellus anzutake]|uniref:uncharacterized protein n=1 Tax=Cantharellus anzutake TaxID=1750568 RepID=UPI001908BE89|nr:uncharacterized protein EI90DRAFT_3043883 [Cantharellus anzutake]KAF8336859.1 hypothetical protein EI90DRAFT_3043883 [Cantharellus anzutake]